MAFDAREFFGTNSENLKTPFRTEMTSHVSHVTPNTHVRDSLHTSSFFIATTQKLPFSRNFVKVERKRPGQGEQ